MDPGGLASTRMKFSYLVSLPERILRASAASLGGFIYEASLLVLPGWLRETRLYTAIVAVTRHLLTVVWSVLSQGKSYRHYSDERIASKYYTWSWQLDEAQRKGLTRPQFVCYYLMRLGVGADLQHVALDPKHPHRLASESEILEIMTDLQPPV